MPISDRCSILIPSCDAYSDLWKPFFTLFFKYWPDCPYPVFLGSNTEDCRDSRVRMIYAGHGKNWSNRVREQLENISSRYVLMMLEDFFLRGPVQTERVEDCLSALETLQGHSIRLTAKRGRLTPVDGAADIGWVPSNEPYRVTTQAGVWNRESLLRLMRPDESIWQFEINGSDRAGAAEGNFLRVRHSVLDYGRHVVERGKWFPDKAFHYAAAGIGCDFGCRPIMSHRAFLWWRIQMVAASLATIAPFVRTHYLMRILRRGRNAR